MHINAATRSAEVLAILLATMALLGGCDRTHSGPTSSAERKPSAPLTDPNGRPWPSRATYIQELPVLNDDGHSEVTVDNRSNGSAVFVKLLDQGVGVPVRQFYIPKGAEFILRDVRAGRYEIRYMDLSNGSASKSDTFVVDERRTLEGIEYSSFTLTLYTVANGNMRMKPLVAGEF